MPYAFSGSCYGTTAGALQAFQKGFPLLGDTVWVWHTSSSINSSGLITYSVVTKPSTTNTTSVRTGTIQLAWCADADAPSSFDPLVASGVFALFFASIVSLWVVAKSAGMILEAIKRW